MTEEVAPMEETVPAEAAAAAAAAAAPSPEVTAPGEDVEEEQDELISYWQRFDEKATTRADTAPAV